MRRFSYLYEIPLFYFLIAVLEHSFIPGRLAFFGISPHPYWFGIGLFGLRYGIYAGLSSGILSSGLYLGLLWFGDFDRYHFGDQEFYLLPGLFVVIGLTLGGWSDRWLSRTRKKDEEIMIHKGNISSLVRELEILKNSNQVLEKETVSQMASLATLYQGARQLGDLDRKSLMPKILDFFSQALNTQKSALYVWEEDRWILSVSKGWNESDNYPKALELSEGIIGKAGSENRIVSIRDWFGGDLNNAWSGRKRADAILAGPLRKSSNQVVGVFCIQDMPFLKFNSASVNLLSLLLDWAGSAIAHSYYIDELKSKSVLDDIYEVYSESYFLSRTKQEFERSKTYSLPFSVLILSTENLSTAPVQNQVHFLRALSRMLLKICRPMDIVTKLSNPESPLAVLMITASRNQAQELKRKMMEVYSKLEIGKMPGSEDHPEVLLKVGVGSYSPNVESADEIISQARKEI